MQVLQSGSGQPVVFVHGFPLDHQMWKGQTLDLDAAPIGLAEGSRLRDRIGSLGEAVVEGGRLRLVLPPGSSGVFVP